MAQPPPDTGSRQQFVLLRAVPPAMRRYVIGIDTVGIAGFVAAVALIGPSAIGRTLSRPELWLVVALTVIADLYPLVPWLRDVRGRLRIHWSGAFALAAMLVGGPPTIVLFPLIAVCATSSLRSAWWRRSFNIVVLTVEALAGVLLLHLAFGPWPRHPGVPELLAAGTALALVWEIVNVGLVCTAMVLMDGLRWRESLIIGWKRTGAWLAALVTSPMIAHLALAGWILVPGLALVTVVVHHSIANLIRRTGEARTDQLTGLANRTAALEVLESGLAQHPRHAETMTLIMLDLDGFKSVNDTYGHDAGDRVLAEVGGRIRQAAEPELTVARLGGDEFVVLGHDVSDPRTAAEVLRAAIRAPVSVGSDTVTLDCSSGWVQVGPGRDAMDVLRAADRELYRSKAARRSADPSVRRAGS